MLEPATRETPARTGDPRTRAPVPGWWPGWGLAAVLAVAVFTAGALVERIVATGGGHPLAYFGVTLFGLLVGATELVARYRDRPTAPLETVPGIVTSR